MNKEPQPLKFTSEEGDTIEITLDLIKHPIAYRRKMYELVHNTGLTENEARHFIDTTPFVMELVYDIDRGLFAVECEAVESLKMYNPYTGFVIPNDNISYQEPNPRQVVDRITCQIEDMTSELDNTWINGDFTTREAEIIDETKEKLQEAVTELHKITDPDEDLSD